MRPPVRASEYERPLQGSSRPQVIRDEHHDAWVVKSSNSQQAGIDGGRTLFNDYVATRFAEELGLPVLPVVPMLVSRDFLDAYPALTSPDKGGFTPGIHFASRYQRGVTLREFQRLKRQGLIASRIENPTDSNGVMAFDTWVLNGDRAKEAPPHRENPDNLLFEDVAEGILRMRMIDHGLCFAGAWESATFPLWPDTIFGHMDAFFHEGWAALTGCLDWSNQITLLARSTLEAIVDEVPGAWRRATPDTEVAALINNLVLRAARLAAIFHTYYPDVEAQAAARPRVA